MRVAEILPMQKAENREEVLSHTCLYDWCNRISEDHEEVVN
jgi:hypothetical protein